MIDTQGVPVVAVAVNSETVPAERVPRVCDRVAAAAGRPAADPLIDGVDIILDAIRARVHSPRDVAGLH